MTAMQCAHRRNKNASFSVLERPALRFSRCRKDLACSIFLQIQPDGLPRITKTPMMEIFPAGALRERMQFAK